MHGIKVLMAKSYIDNLSEETRNGMLAKAEQGIWSSAAPLDYRNADGANGKRVPRRRHAHYRTGAERPTALREAECARKSAASQFPGSELLLAGWGIDRDLASAI